MGRNKAITIQTKYIPWRKYILVDQLSCRCQVIVTEWSLVSQNSAKDFPPLEYFHVDMFAVILNRGFLCMSSIPDLAQKVDAFRRLWNNHRPSDSFLFALTKEMLNRVMILDGPHDTELAPARIVPRPF